MGTAESSKEDMAKDFLDNEMNETACKSWGLRGH